MKFESAYTNSLPKFKKFNVDFEDKVKAGLMNLLYRFQINSYL